MTVVQIFDSFLSYPAVGLTIKATFLALLLQLIIGLPLGLYLAGRSGLIKSVVEILVTLPMIFPPIALGFFLLLVLGKNSPIGSCFIQVFHLKIIFAFPGILLATFLVGLPFMVKSVQAARQQLPDSLKEVAQTLGKSRLQIFRFVLLPNIKNGVVAGLLLAFGRSIGEVGISLMLGGNIIGRTETLSLAIYNAVFDGNFFRAAVFSGFLSLIAVGVMLILNLVNHRSLSFFHFKQKV